MKTLFPHVLTAGASLLLLGSGIATLHAQTPLPKIFVASTGNDANDGSRGSPKRNFQAAHDAVAPGGQIVVLDTSGYGALTITKSISITVPPGVNGFVTITDPNASGIIINAGASDVVSLRGLIVEGGGSGSFGNGIVANTVGSLAIEDCTVRNFNEGIYVFSTTAAKCYVHRCTVRGCQDGLILLANSSVAIIAVATGCRLEQNSAFGAVAGLNSGSGSVDLTLADCVMAGNGAAGVSSQAAATVVVRVDNCRITSNKFGASSVFGGQILSRGNNTLEHNPNGNTFPATYSAK